MKFAIKATAVCGTHSFVEQLEHGATPFGTESIYDANRTDLIPTNDRHGVNVLQNQII